MTDYVKVVVIEHYRTVHLMTAGEYAKAEEQGVIDTSIQVSSDFISEDIVDVTKIAEADMPESLLKFLK